MRFFALVFIVISLFSTNSYAEERTEALCYREQQTRDTTLEKINEFVARRAEGNMVAKPPGLMIKLGPFGDPRFQGPGWEKWATTEIHQYDERTVIFGQVIDVTHMRSVVEIHYMINMNTLAYDQVKFKSSYEQGCVGKKVAKLRGETPPTPSPVAQVSLVEEALVGRIEERYVDDCGGNGGRIIAYNYEPNFEFKQHAYMDSTSRWVVRGGWVDTGGQIVPVDRMGDRGGCR